MFLAWREFCRGKRKRLDVQQFEFNLEDNLFQLHQELKDKTYKHFHYTPFYIQDPKLRHIHKACVRDRVLHQAVFRILYPIFDKGFIFDSYSSRLNKGTHRAVKRLEKFSHKLSRNNHRNIFALKCDIKKFFDSEVNRLIRVTKKALKRGIGRVKPGKTLGDVGHAIQRYIEDQDFHVVKELCGHGIGKQLQEEPEVLNFGQRHKGEILKSGMVLAIEPMAVIGNPEIKKCLEGGDICYQTIDNSLSAHFEHTVAVTDGGPRVLTE